MISKSAHLNAYLKFTTIYSKISILLLEKIRSVDPVKGQFRFTPVLYFEAALKEIEKLDQSDYEPIIQKYVEMNVTILLEREMDELSEYG